MNLGTSHEVSIRELVGVISQLTGFAGEIRWDASFPDGQPRRKLNVDRARKAFGFTAEVTLEDGLRRTVEWFEAYRRDGQDH